MFGIVLQKSNLHHPEVKRSLSREEIASLLGTGNWECCSETFYYTVFKRRHRFGTRLLFVSKKED